VSKILREDFKYIYENEIFWGEIKNCSIFITGATGYIGSILVQYLDYLNTEYNMDIKIIALIRSVERAKEVLNKCSNVQYIIGDLLDLPEIPPKIDYIFHCAAITKSKEMINTPVQVADVIINGTKNILKLAREKKVKNMIYVSSMEVYGQTALKNSEVYEKDLGYIDIFNERSCYPLGKRMAENLCYDYFIQYKVPVKIARLAQTFGAGILKYENRIFAQLATSVIFNKDIILHSKGDSYGNYCYIADAITALFILLLKGINGEAYNISNESTNMTIYEMATLVANNIAGGKIGVVFDIPKDNIYGYAAPVNIKISSQKIRCIGWKPRYGIEHMYDRMISYMREQEW
jgi:nucleoside-diphosphate-sugar epimerase